VRILVLGASGMIGSAMFRVLSSTAGWVVYGTLRSAKAKSFFDSHQAKQLIEGIDIDRFDDVVRVIGQVQPDVVINCIGLTKHHVSCNDPLQAIPINALLPHRLAHLCAAASARLIHISTDCVFAGTRGNYLENDPGDATDIYGKAKLLGEVTYPHTITLRTSTIGHELQSTYGLLEWFLSQTGSCKGFTRAIFSGLPNTVFAQVVRDYVIPNAHLSGLYHVGAAPINKYDLLQLIANTYSKKIEIIQDESFAIDRSFSSERFCNATGYTPPTWLDLIRIMHDHHTHQLPYV
jgi:dTDP-4-dehydrorhamnose reductase